MESMKFKSIIIIKSISNFNGIFVMFLMCRVFKKFKKKNSEMKLGKQLRNVGLDSNLISYI